MDIFFIGIVVAIIGAIVLFSIGFIIENNNKSRKKAYTTAGWIFIIIGVMFGNDRFK